MTRADLIYNHDSLGQKPPDPQTNAERNEPESFMDFGIRFIRLHTSLAPDLREYIPTDKEIPWKIGRNETTLLKRADYDKDFPRLQANVAQLGLGGLRHKITFSSIDSDERTIRIDLLIIMEGKPGQHKTILRYDFGDGARPMIDNYREVEVF